jgi:hypothetical protein
MEGERIFDHPTYGRWAYWMVWGMVGGVSRPIGVCLESKDDPPRAITRRLHEAVEAFDRDQRSESMRREAARIGGTLGQRLERLASVQGSPRALTPEHLRRVASIYRTEIRAAKETGRRAKPRERIKEEMDVSLAAASKYIARARATDDPTTGRPFLEPTKGREH